MEYMKEDFSMVFDQGLELSNGIMGRSLREIGRMA